MIHGQNDGALDMNTLKLLGHQAARRRYWLGLPVPDRDEAAACMRRIDEILDRRPRPFIVDSSGEVVMSDASPWVQDQAENSLVPIVAPVADTDLTTPTGGGTALLERAPNDPTELLTAEQESEIRRFGRKLFGL